MIRVRTLQLLLALIPNSLSAQASSRDWWQALPEGKREVFVHGYEQGTFAGMRVSFAMAGQLPPATDPERQLVASLSAPQKTLLKRIADEHYKTISIEEFGIRVVTQTMTQLYDDPANSFVPSSEMVKVALMRLQGDSQAAIDHELEMLRRLGAERPPASNKPE